MITTTTTDGEIVEVTLIITGLFVPPNMFGGSKVKGKFAQSERDDETQFIVAYTHGDSNLVIILTERYQMTPRVRAQIWVFHRKNLCSRYEALISKSKTDLNTCYPPPREILKLRTLNFIICQTVTLDASEDLIKHL
ncbi:unnamed protein product [Hymenolepis diminuta]|uniref:Sema domain-containing protein n=1 Tax=Hymenolepis diminuta TaxID=6216 RepID=A0A158QEA3_HYMDI|nr:unnamed protein product [Hymenolepis diminuta]